MDNILTTFEKVNKKKDKRNYKSRKKIYIFFGIFLWTVKNSMRPMMLFFHYGAKHFVAATKVFISGH